MINLGDVNFSVGADVAGLTRSVQALNQFGRTVDQVQGIVGRGAAANAAAFRRQEQAAGAAFTKIQNLNQAMAGMEGSSRFIRANESAFQQLNRTLTSGQLSALEYQRAMQAFSTQTQSTTRAFQQHTAATNGLNASNKNLVAGLQNVASGFVLVNGPLGGIATRIVNVTSVIKRGGVEVAAFIAGLAAGGYIITRFGDQILEAGIKFKQFYSLFQATSGSLLQSWVEVDKASAIARKTGTQIADIVPAMARFEVAAQGTGLSGKQISEAFYATAAAASKLQLSSEDVGGVFKALEQMMSKGVVQSEELRGQLGDRLPGAFNIAARAMGVSTAQLQAMMKKGLVPAATFMPKFAAELRKTFNIDDKPINNYTTAINNLHNAQLQFFAALDDQLGISNAVMNSIKQLTVAIDYLRDHIGQVKIVVVALVGALGGLIAPAVIGGIGSLVAWMGRLAFAMGGVNAALMLLGGLPALFIRLALVIGGATLAMSKFGDEIFPVAGHYGTLQDYMTVAWDNFTQHVQERAPQVVAAIQTINQSTGNVWKDLVSNSDLSWKAAEKIVGDATNWFLNQVVNLSSAFITLLSNMPQLVASAAIDAFNSAGAAITDGINKLTQLIADFKNSVLGMKDGVLKDIVGWVGDKLGGALDLGKLGTDMTKEAKGLGLIWADVPNAYKDAWDSTDIQVRAIMNRQRNYVADMNKGLLDLQNQADAVGRNRTMSNFRQSELKGWGQDLSLGGVKPIGGGPAVNNAPAQSQAQINAARKKAQALEDINREIARTQEAISAYSLSGATGFKLLNEQFKREDEVRKYARALEKTGYSAEFVKQKSAELMKGLTDEAKWKKATEALTQWQSAMTQAFDQVGSTLVDALFDGGESLKKLPDIAKAVAKDIFNTFLQLSLMNPLKNMLFGTDLPTTGGFGGGGGLGGSIANLFGLGFMDSLRQGGVVQRVVRAANGRMLTSPTTMMTSGGPVQGGEAGTEAIMPLTRDSSGRMGVAAHGFPSGSAPSKVTVNNYNAKDNQISVREGQDSSGQHFVDITVAKVFNKFARGDADPIMASRYGSRVPATRRG